MSLWKNKRLAAVSLMLILCLTSCSVDSPSGSTQPAAAKDKEQLPGMEPAGYVHPDAERVIADLKKNNPNNQHPRLFAREETFERLKKAIVADPLERKWYTSLRKSADKMLAKPVGAYATPDGRRMPSAKDARPIIEQTAMMYRLSGEEKYAQRAVQEMLALAAFPDWNDKKEFLNTAEMTAGMGIGYDWLYDYLSSEQKDLIRRAIVDKGLQKALDAHAGNVWWTSRTDPVSNWTAVCNGGIIVGALAIGDEEPAVAGRVIAESLRSIENVVLPEFSPDGGWSEGPGYWRYTVEYLVSYMAALQTAVGSTYGHVRTPGLQKTGYFPVYDTGPQGTFNFADANSGKMKIPELFWIAEQTGDARLAGFRLTMMADAKQSGGVYDMLWYDPKLHPETEAELPPDKYFRKTEVVTMRSRWNDPDAAFVGFKAGNGVASHAHSDAGEFVFQADGVQWAIDPGPDDYNLKGYFNYDKERYTYYRLKPEGHNTLVIHPDSGFQQDPRAMNKITAFASRPSGAFAVADLQPAYAKYAVSAKRGVRFLDRRRLIVEDELEAKAPSVVWWFMHTKASIQVAADGRFALLTQDGKRLWAAISVPPGEAADASFQVMDAVPLPESPDPKGQTPNSGIRKLAIKLNGVSNVKLAVELVPLKAGEPVPSAAEPYVPLDQWKTSE